MEAFEKQLLIIFITMIAGAAIVFAGFPDWLHNSSISVLKPFLGKYTKDKGASISESLGYIPEILLAVLILITPLCGVSAPWFLKIAYELSFGKNAGVNVFVISPGLNWVMVVLCIILFGYSIYSQFHWAVESTQPKPKTNRDKDLARLI